MLKHLILILFFILPAIAPAQEFYEHSSGLRFPAAIGKFQRMPVRNYDDPRLGIQIPYIAPGFGKADFYVFDYGLSPIPDGSNSDFVKSLYAAADKDVQSFAATGKYLDFEKALPLGSVIHFPGQQLEWLVASYKFRFTQESSEALVSWLLLTGYRKHFIKIRFSHLASRENEGRPAIQALLEAFENNNGLQATETIRESRPQDSVPNPVQQ